MLPMVDMLTQRDSTACALVPLNRLQQHAASLGAGPTAVLGTCV